MTEPAKPVAKKKKKPAGPAGGAGGAGGGEGGSSSKGGAVAKRPKELKPLKVDKQSQESGAETVAERRRRAREGDENQPPAAGTPKKKKKKKAAPAEGEGEIEVVVDAGEGGARKAPAKKKKKVDPAAPSSAKKKQFSKEYRSLAIDEEDVVEENTAVSAVKLQQQVASEYHKATFVQESEKGPFRRVATGHDEKKEEPRPVEQQADTEELSRYQRIMNRVGAMLAALFVFCQGMLGGMAMLSFFLTYALFENQLDFLRWYSSVADDFSRFFYWFSIVSLIAALDQYSKDRLANFYGRPLRQVWDVVLLVSYALVFIVNLIAGPFDELLAYSERRIPRWWEEIPLTSSFKDDIDLYHAQNALRLFAAIVGWIMISMDAGSKPYEFNASNKALYEITNKDDYDALYPPDGDKGGDPAAPTAATAARTNNFFPNDA